jgi:aspartate dehydrogenase
MTQSPSSRPPVRVAIAGLGAIGLQLAHSLDRGLAGYTLAAASANDKVKAAERLSHGAGRVPVVAIDELEPLADLVIECAPAQLLADIIGPFLRAGKSAMVLSCGALLEHPELVDAARRHGGQIIVPSGALLGLDAVTAAAEGEIRSVRMITRKPVRGLLGAPYLQQHDIRIDDLTAPKQVFSGSARDAAAGFPANVNVAVALALAGIGPDRTMIEIWADPSLTRNTHRIEVEADSASFAMSIENIPSENPRTGRITALSAIACLRKMTAPIRVGT